MGRKRRSFSSLPIRDNREPERDSGVCQRPPNCCRSVAVRACRGVRRRTAGLFDARVAIDGVTERREFANAREALWIVGNGKFENPFPDYRDADAMGAAIRFRGPADGRPLRRTVPQAGDDARRSSAMGRRFREGDAGALPHHRRDEITGPSRRNRPVAGPDIEPLN